MLCNTLPSSTAPSPCTLVTTCPPYIHAHTHTEGSKAWLRSHFPPRYSPCNILTAGFCYGKAAQGRGHINSLVLYDEESCSEAALWCVTELDSLEMDKKIFALVVFILWLSDKGSGTKPGPPPSFSQPPSSSSAVLPSPVTTCGVQPWHPTPFNPPRLTGQTSGLKLGGIWCV